MDTTQTVKNLLDLAQAIDKCDPDFHNREASALAEEMAWQVEGLVEALAKGGPTPDWKAIWKQMRN